MPRYSVTVTSYDNRPLSAKVMPVIGKWLLCVVLDAFLIWFVYMAVTGGGGAMDWLDYFGWWLEKFNDCEQHLKVITREQWIDLLDAYDAADATWQAAFNGVMAGVDEELIDAVAQVCRTEVHCLGNAEDFSGEIWAR